MSVYEIKKKQQYPSTVNVRKFHGARGNLPEQRQQRRRQHPLNIYMHHEPMFPGQTPAFHMC
jgi:hypothetical protein